MTAPVLQVVLGAEQLQELADLVVKKLLAASPADTYDQEHPPPGMSRRTFLNAARAGKFPTRKVGRTVVASRADVDQWRATLPSAETRSGKVATKAARPANDADAPADDPELARLRDINLRPRG